MNTLTNKYNIKYNTKSHHKKLELYKFDEEVINEFNNFKIILIEQEKTKQIEYQEKTKQIEYQEKTKQEQEKTKQEEEKTKQEEEKTKQEQEKTKQLKLELQLLKLKINK